jgi:hypothetical protein
VAALVADLDAAAAHQPQPARTVIRRLNRVEYTNAVRDLLALDLPLASELPQDGVAGGFDNIADALSISPLLLERYLKVARRVSELAMGVSDPSPVTEIYPATKTQAAWQGDGLPFGTRGGIRVRHYFPHDGDYDVRAFLAKESLTPLEGVRLFRTRLPVTAGSHTVVVAFPDHYAEREGPVLDVGGPGGSPLGGPLDLLGTAIRPTIEFRIDGRRAKLFEIRGMTSGEAAFDGQPGPPTLARIEIAGPYRATGAAQTESRKRILVCDIDDKPCAARIIAALARRAYRREVTESDTSPLLAAFSIARAKGTFDTGIAAAIRDMLLAPDFLFRIELDPDAAIASRLSFFLWSSIPDEALLADAASGGLRGAGRAAHVRRMLADPRSGALVDNFVVQWLGLRALADIVPDKEKFPEYDSALAAAFQTETRLFVQSLVRGNRPVLELLGADHTYLDERLARHYGVPGVVGPGFRRVSLASSPRPGGLLAHGSVLLMTSHAARTSPVLRGKWILDSLLNSPPPPPPRHRAAARRVPRQRAQAHRARAGGAAPRQSRVRLLPRANRSDGPCARELRRAGPLARARRRLRDRRLGHHAQRRRVHRAPGAQAGIAGPARGVCPRHRRAPAHLRPRSGAGRPRPARRS